MSIPTITAARTYLAQKDGLTGMQPQLSFEKFPSVGLSKVRHSPDKNVSAYYHMPTQNFDILLPIYPKTLYIFVSFSI